MRNWSDTPIEPRFRTIDGLTIWFAESEDRYEHALAARFITGMVQGACAPGRQHQARPFPDFSSGVPTARQPFSRIATLANRNAACPLKWAIGQQEPAISRYFLRIADVAQSPHEFS